MGMATIVPHGELARRALAWLAEQAPELGAAPAGPAEAAKLERLVEEAAMRFNLGPLDVEFLRRTLLAGKNKADSGQ